MNIRKFLVIIIFLFIMGMRMDVYAFYFTTNITEAIDEKDKIKYLDCNVQLMVSNDDSISYLILRPINSSGIGEKLKITRDSGLEEASGPTKNFCDDSLTNVSTFYITKMLDADKYKTRNLKCGDSVFGRCDNDYCYLKTAKDDIYVSDIVTKASVVNLTTKPDCSDNSNTGSDSGNTSGGNNSNTGSDSGNTSGDNSNTGSDSGNTSGDNSNTGSDSGNTSGGDNSNTGSDSGNTSGGDSSNIGNDSGNTSGGDNSNTGNDAGNTSGDNSNTGSDSGNTSGGDSSNTGNDSGNTSGGDNSNTGNDSGNTSEGNLSDYDSSTPGDTSETGVTTYFITLSIIALITCAAMYFVKEYNLFKKSI